MARVDALALIADRPYPNPTPGWEPPRGKGGRPEDVEAKACAVWLAKNFDGLYTHAANERTSLGMTGRMKAQGTRKGWPDYILIRKGRGALVELKRADGNWHLSEAQGECIREARAQGIFAEVAWGEAHFIEIVTTLFELEATP
jgi:hypothetical protein